VIAASQLVVVRILLRSLGTEHYAVFALLYGLSGWYLLADCGVGFSIQNLISERRKRGGREPDLVLSAALASVILFIIEIVLLFLFRGLAGRAFLHQFSLAAEEKGTLFFVAGALLTAIGVGTISYRIWYGQQRGYLANLAPGLGAVAGLLAVTCVSQFSIQHKLLWSLVAFIGPNSATAMAGVAVQLWGSRDIDWAKAIRDSTPSIAKRARRFWVFSVMAAGVLQVDYIVIARLLAPEQIIVYTVTTRIFLFVGTIYTSALYAVWPVFTELTFVGEWQPVKHHLKIYVASGMALVLVFSAVLLFNAQSVAHLLSPIHQIVIPRNLILLLAAYYIVRVWCDSFATVLQSMSDLKPLWISVPVQALLSAICECGLGAKWGACGIVAGLILSYLLTVAWWLPFKVSEHMNASKLSTHAEIIYLHSNV
jgi:O-antigen/teichoic acid export membrane protein